MNADQHIAETLANYGEPFTGTVRHVQGTAVISHKALERIAARAGITFDPPSVLRAERDEAVLLALGRMGERSEWSIGEALLNVNYRVPGKEPAYVYAKAEERAKDRVILKLIGLHGLLYSEEEADQFGENWPTSNENTPAQGIAADDQVATGLKRKLDGAKTVEAVTALMTAPETQRIMATLPPTLKEQVRDCAKARMVALGWIPKKAA